MAVNVKTIEFQENTAVITMRDPDSLGGETRKRVSIESLVSGLASINTCTKLLIPSNCRGIWEDRSGTYFLFIIPGHKGKCAVRWTRSDSESYGSPGADTRMREQPENIQTMYEELEGVKIFDIPFPTAAIFIRTTKSGSSYVFNSMRAWALKSDRLPLDKTRIYNWPLFNMYSDARVCIGDIPKTYPTIDAVRSICNYLYIGVGNHDLDSTNYVKNNNALCVDSPFELVKKLHEDKFEVFPDEILKNFAPSLTETIESLIENNN